MSKKVTNVYLRNGTWHLDYIHPITKKRIRRSAETTIKEKAIELFNREYGQAWDQANLGAPTNKTIRELTEWCWETFWSLKQGSNKENRDHILRTFLNKHGNEKASALSADQLATYMKERFNEVKKRTVQLEFTHLACAYNQGIKNGMLAKNPFRQIDSKLFREGTNGKKGRTRVATQLEVELMLGHTAGMLNKIIEFDLNSGLRKGQIENLKWSDVDMINRRMTVVCGKGGEFRNYTVPIFDRAYEILKSLPQDTEYVFTNQEGKKIPKDGLIHASFPRLIDRLQIKDFKFHDLRHSFATEYYRRTLNLISVQRILGHTSSRTTEIYLNLTDADLVPSNNFRFPAACHKNDTEEKQVAEKMAKMVISQPFGV